MSKITTSVLIIFLSFFLYACNDDATSTKTTDTKKTDATNTDGANARPDSPDKTTICYAGTQTGEDAAIELTIDKNNITGYFSWSPHEKDGSFGKLTGSMDKGKIIADYTHVIEGDTQTSQVALVLKGNTLIQGTGELIKKGDKLVFKNPSKIEWDNTYNEVDCNKVNKLLSLSRKAIK